MGIALCDVVERGQLEEYYRQEGLADVDARIERLMKDTGALAIRGSDIDQAATLKILEETVFLGHWRYFGDAK